MEKIEKKQNCSTDRYHRPVLKVSSRNLTPRPTWRLFSTGRNTLDTDARGATVPIGQYRLQIRYWCPSPTGTAGLFSTSVFADAC